MQVKGNRKPRLCALERQCSAKLCRNVHSWRISDLSERFVFPSQKWTQCGRWALKKKTAPLHQSFIHLKPRNPSADCSLGKWRRQGHPFDQTHLELNQMTCLFDQITAVVAP